jgi:phosphatidylglycerophosphate synthase
MSVENRRELKARRVPFFQNFASQLVKWGLTPNQVSVLSAVFAIFGAFCFTRCFVCHSEGNPWILLLGTLFIQLRLLCNLLDGLMAVEGGLKTPAGELFNDVPDRVADVVLIMGAGVFAQQFWPGMIHIAWLAAVLAVGTAYVRTIGAAMTGKHDFSGPMAKQHRMFVLTVGGIGSAIESFAGVKHYSMMLAICLIAMGAAITCVSRVMKLYRRLNSQAKSN